MLDVPGCPVGAPLLVVTGFENKICALWKDGIGVLESGISVYRTSRSFELVLDGSLVCR